MASLGASEGEHGGIGEIEQTERQGVAAQGRSMSGRSNESKLVQRRSRPGDTFPSTIVSPPSTLKEDSSKVKSGRPEASKLWNAAECDCDSGCGRLAGDGPLFVCSSPVFIHHALSFCVSLRSLLYATARHLHG